MLPPLLFFSSPRVPNYTRCDPTDTLTNKRLSLCPRNNPGLCFPSWAAESVRPESRQMVTLLSQGLSEGRRYHSSSFAVFIPLWAPPDASFLLLGDLFSLCWIEKGKSRTGNNLSSLATPRVRPAWATSDSQRNGNNNNNKKAKRGDVFRLQINITVQHTQEPPGSTHSNTIN